KNFFNWGWLTGSEVQSIIIKVGAWQHPGRHGAGRAESSTSSSEGCYQNTRFQAARMRVLKPDTHSDTPTPTGPHLLKVPFPGPSIYKQSQRVCVCVCK
ncbi:mCG1028420, partial [Mus musculus]